MPRVALPHVHHPQVQSPFLFGETVRVLQWNVLAQALATNNDNFVRLAPASAALDWKHHRRWRMIEVHTTQLCCVECLLTLNAIILVLLYALDIIYYYISKKIFSFFT